MHDEGMGVHGFPSRSQCYRIASAGNDEVDGARDGIEVP